MTYFNQTGSTAEVLIYEEIGEAWGEGISAKVFLEELAALPEDTSQITVRINSPGGDVFDAAAIENALRRHPAKVVTAIDGLAASAASVVAMAGERIVMAENAMMMIHDPWVIVLGNATELRELADRLEQIGESIAKSYARRPGVDLDTIRAAMAAETWYTAEEAIEAGLADELTEGARVAAALIDPKRYHHTPRQYWAYLPPHPPQARRKIEAAKRTLTLLGLGGTVDH